MNTKQGVGSTWARQVYSVLVMAAVTSGSLSSMGCFGSKALKALEASALAGRTFSTTCPATYTSGNSADEIIAYAFANGIDATTMLLTITLAHFAELGCRGDKEWSIVIKSTLTPRTDVEPFGIRHSFATNHASALFSSFIPHTADIMVFDGSIDSVTTTPLNADAVTFFNTSSRCGKTDWTANTAKEIAVTDALPQEASTTVAGTCSELYNGAGLNPFAGKWLTTENKVIAQGVGSKFYNMLAVEAVDYNGTASSVLRVGATDSDLLDGKSEATRPNSFARTIIHETK